MRSIIASYSVHLVSRACLSCCLGVFTAGCLRIAVPPPSPPETAISPKVVGSDAGTGHASVPDISLVFSGVPEVNRADFATALPSTRTPAARLFGSRVTNRTGSLRKLLEPALRGLVAQEALQSGNAGLRGELAVTELVLEWRPPQEFIKTPRARHPGQITLRLIGSWTVRTASRPQQTLRERPFRLIRSERAFPGQEAEAMSELMGVALRDLVGDLAGGR